IRRDSQLSTASTDMERRRRLDHRNSEIQIEEILERVFLDVTSPQTASCDVQIPSRINHSKKIVPPSPVKSRSLTPQSKAKELSSSRPAVKSTIAVKKTSIPKAVKSVPAVPKPAVQSSRPSIAKNSWITLAGASSARPSPSRAASSSATRKSAAAAQKSTMTRTTSKLPQKKIEVNPVRVTEDRVANPLVVECQSEEVSLQAHRVITIPAAKTAKMAVPAAVPPKPQPSNGSAATAAPAVKSLLSGTKKAAVASVSPSLPSTKSSVAATRGKTAAIASRGGRAAAGATTSSNGMPRGGKRA
ncbi:hypothetical protein PMAYCL1PPCAC_30200, partial [Pristionchus mayeri]